MKKIVSFLFLFALAASVQAGQIALVYENDQAVLANQSTVGTITPDGIFISAKLALASASTLLVGIPGDSLRKGSLVRLDNTIDVALVGLGTVVSNQKLQDAFQKKAAAFTSFSPAATSTSSVVGSMSSQVAQSTEPFSLRINGQDLGGEPIELIMDRKKSEMSLEITRIRNPSIWSVEVLITSDKKIYFWKKGKVQTLSDVPSTRFQFKHQLLFDSLGLGQTFTVPIELSGIKEESSVLSLTVTGKGEILEKKVSIHFTPKK